MKQIPNLFTLLNLFFGCLAIVFILQNGIAIEHTEAGAQFIDIPQKMWLASLCIGIAAVVDFLDGFVARLFKAESELGAQLDSLADVVSFGVAPAMILYQFLRMAFAKESEALDTSILWLLPAFLVALAGAYRLGRFNIDKEQSLVFKGVPIPAIGLLIASLPLIYWNTQQSVIIELLLNKWFLYAIIIFVSWLMVSKIPLLTLKFKNYGIADNLPKYILLGVSLLSILLLGWLSVPVIFIAYIILSLLFKNKLV